VLPEGISHVAEPERTGLLGKTRSDQPRDRHRKVRPKREQAPVEVHEPERSPFERACGGLEDVEALDNRRLDAAIPPRREKLAHARNEDLALGGLGRQHVSKASGCDWTHGLLLTTTHVSAATLSQ